MMLGIVQKRPADVLDYDIEFADWIADLGDSDTITVATAVLDVTGELVIDSTQISGSIVKIWLSGGVDGSTYVVTLSITTAAGRFKEVDFKVRVRDC
jgi:hypothetical protein